MTTEVSSPTVAQSRTERRVIPRRMTLGPSHCRIAARHSCAHDTQWNGIAIRNSVSRGNTLGSTGSIVIGGMPVDVTADLNRLVIATSTDLATLPSLIRTKLAESTRKK
jgi:hypothetical protein